jgi:deoxyribonucleoside regulator
MASENQRLVYLAQVAQLYYEQGKTEAEIASQLKISPEEVNTLLEEARQQDVVTFHVRHPWQTDSALEDELTSVFKLKAARVLKRGERAYEEMLTDLGTLAAHYFQKILKNDSTIGISWGSALYQMIQAIHPAKMPDVEVVQLIGATGTENMAADGPLLAQLLANRLGSRAKYLHAPLLVSSEAGRDALLQERSIRETLARAEAVSIALVGIGTTDPSLYSLLRAGYVTEQDVERLRQSGAVGDVCAQHFNENGEWLNIDTNRRVIGIRLDTIRKVDTVIGVAGGPEKTRAILAALRGQYVNVLVTDDQTARAILAMQRGEKPAYVEAPRESKTAEVPLVSLKGVWKVFSGVPVLRGVDIELCPGQVHALLGGNGSGKSTLMKILSGIYQADAGAVELDGSPIDLEGPAFAHAHGIYLVPQEPKIFPHLSVMENLLVGSTLDPAETREKVQRLAESLGFEGGLNDPAGSLNIANQQILEIMRGLIRNLRVLILDEPTSTLTFREVESLFNRMRKLTSQGIGIFFISHRLNEILEISDYVSVLRDGNFVLSAPTAALTSRDLIRAMLPETSEGETAMAVRRLSPARVGLAMWFWM